jgi:hypothetical protein
MDAYPASGAKLPTAEAANNFIEPLDGLIHVWVLQRIGLDLLCHERTHELESKLSAREFVALDGGKRIIQSLNGTGFCCNYLTRSG